MAFVVIAVAGGVRAYAADGQIDGDPAGVIAYVKEHMDDKYRDESFDMYMHDSVEHLEVRNTLVDQAQVAPGTSIDEFYEHPDWRDAMYMTYPGTTTLYYASHDWLVALVDASRVNGLKADVSDVDVAANNPYADIVEGAVYDNETGLLYIPRDVLENDDLSSKWSESFKDGIVAQTMMRIDPTNVSCSLPVEVRRTGMFGVKTTEFMNVPFAGFDQTFFLNLGTSSKVTTSDIWTFTSGSTTSMQMGSGDMQLKDGVFALSITPFAYTGLVVEVDTSSEGIGGLLSSTRAYAAGGADEPMSTDIADFNMYPFGYVELNPSLWKIGHPSNDYEQAMQGTAYTYMGAVLDALAMMQDPEYIDLNSEEAKWGLMAKNYFDTGAGGALNPSVLGVANTGPGTYWSKYLHLQLNDLGANGGEPHNSAIPDNYPQIPESEIPTYESSWIRFRDFVRAGRVGTMPQLQEAGDVAAFTHAFLLPADDRVQSIPGVDASLAVMNSDWWRNIKSANLDTKDRWVFAACSHVTMPIPKDFSGVSALTPTNGGFLGENENAYNCFIKFLDVNTDAEVPYVVFGMQSLPFGHLGDDEHVQESQAILKVRLGGSTRVHKVAKRDIYNDDITEGNSAYNLAGAEYKYYTDRGCTNVAKLADGTDAVVTTDADGNTNTLVLPIGKYYVKETKASVGFKLDREVHEVDVNGYRGEGTPATAVVESQEPPLTDPISLQKFDTDAFAAERSTDAQGDGNLSGAVFQINYYNSYLSESQLGNVTPTRSWKIKTYPTRRDDGSVVAATGMQFAYEDPEHYLVENDPKDFYLVVDDSGMIRADLPLGTVAVREVAPPEGYLAHDAGTSEAKTYYAHIVTNAANHAIIEWQNWSDTTGTLCTVKDKVFTGGLDVKKVDSTYWGDKSSGLPDKKMETGQGDATLAGAKFRVYNVSDNAIYLNGVRKDSVGKVTLTDEQMSSGKITWLRDLNTSVHIDDNTPYVAELTTDEKGECHMDMGSLPYGTYVLREVAPPSGYTTGEQWHTGAVFAVREDQQKVSFSQLLSKGHYTGRDEWDESVTYEFGMSK